MVKVIKSWFNDLKEWALKGVMVSESVHKLSPVKSESGKGWWKCDCLLCKSVNAFLFRSHTDGTVYASFCHKCKKYSRCCKHGNNIATCKECRKPKSICKAIKADGTPCTFKAKKNGYCGIHGSR